MKNSGISASLDSKCYFAMAVSDLGAIVNSKKLEKGRYALLRLKQTLVLKQFFEMELKDTIFIFENVSNVVVRRGAGVSILRFDSNLGSSEFRFSNFEKAAMDDLVISLESMKSDRHENYIQPSETDIYLKGKDIHSIFESYKNVVNEPILSEQGAKSKTRFKILVRLVSYLKPYKRRVVFGLLSACSFTVLGLLPSYVTGKLIDDVFKPFESGQSALSKDSTQKIAAFYIGLIALTYFLREFFVWIRLRSMSMLGEWVARDLRNELFVHLNKLSVSFFSSKQTGSLISRITSDTDRIWDFIAFGVIEVSVSLLTLIGLGSILIILDLRLGLLITIPIPFLLFAIYRHGEKMQILFLRAFRKWSNLTDVLSDTIPGVRIVKAFSQEGRENRRFLRRNDDVTLEFNRIHTSWTSFWPKLILMVHFLVIMVWALGVPRVLGMTEGHVWFGDHLSSGKFVSFILYMTMFVQPIEVIGQMARMLNRATSSAYRIFDLLDTEPKIVDRSNALFLKKESCAGSIQLEDVRFSYSGLREVIKGISLKVEPGEMIGIAGSSGSGKSTLINLVARFYDVTGGSIRIDGIDVRDIQSSSLRKTMGIVLQDPYLFHGRILENIRYGHENADLKDVIDAARAANAHEFIMKLPDGYDTIVGERGHTLSGGERQRISIARAILHNPKILILDEATSAVDTETEKKIQEALDRLIKGRTVLAIAHRLSTLANANRIVVVENGKIVEVGRPSDLMNIEDSKYRKLVSIQGELCKI